MTLKARLAAMMVLILVAVLALQYLLMERERQQLLTHLEELSADMNRTTAGFVEQVRDASTGRHEPQISALLADLSNIPDLERRGGVTLKLVTWADSLVTWTDTTSENRFFDESRFDVHVQVMSGDSLGVLRGGENSIWRENTEAFHFSPRPLDSLEFTQDGNFRGVMVRRFSNAAGHDLVDTLRSEDAGGSITRGYKPVAPGQNSLTHIGEWNTEMVINLPVGGGAADSFYSVQVRYPLDSLTGELERSRKSGLLWLGAVLAVGILGAVLVASQFTRPIRTLQESFGRVESGDLDVSVKPERSDEIGQLTTSFNDMVEQLRDSKEVESRLMEAERLASIGRLAAGVAHEVRNPLNTILLSMQQMRDKLHIRMAEDAARGPRQDSSSPGADPAAHSVDQDFERYYRIVTGEIARLESMVSAFLDLSKSEELRFVSTDVSVQLAHAVELFRPEAESRGIRIEQRVGQPLFIAADESRLPMVWNNLLANALAATPVDSSVLVQAVRQDNGVVVTVEDQGAGVPPELRDRIWDPFFSGKDNGTGLGLSIVRSVVERHGGSVSVLPAHTDPYTGARFEVFLPIDQEVSSVQEDQ